MLQHLFPFFYNNCTFADVVLLPGPWPQRFLYRAQKQNAAPPAIDVHYGA
jgi:hypothetical protein